ncbi:hypothetical protein ACMX25_21990 [Caballeronia sp. 15715]|uniref:hypothetical protein n=1 Tax=Caballeronia sp. 15715 TaxID=3391030 RepID=UPI0039E5D189
MKTAFERFSSTENWESGLQRPFVNWASPFALTGSDLFYLKESEAQNFAMKAIMLSKAAEGCPRSPVLQDLLRRSWLLGSALDSAWLVTAWHPA